MTVSGSNISVTGNTTLGDNSGADTITINGHITASGNISASGNVYGVTGSFSHVVGNSPITIGSPVTFTSPITASSGSPMSGSFIGDGSQLTNLCDRQVGYIGSIVENGSSYVSCSERLTTGNSG